MQTPRQKLVVRTSVLKGGINSSLQTGNYSLRSTEILIKIIGRKKLLAQMVTNMLNLKVNRLIPLSMFSLLLSGCWGIICESSPVQAQIPNKNLLLAQSEPMQPIEFNNQNYQYDQPGQYTQSNPNSDKYFVYVDNNSSQLLQRVKQVERTAYIRNYNGRNMIQAGVFTSQSNAQRRIRELESKGIFGAGIGSYQNPDLITVIPTTTATTNSNNIVPTSVQTVSPEINNSYYVVIPGNSNNLRYLEQELRQTLSIYNININVSMRTQPRGAHIAIGPFRDRLDAEQWNNLFKKSGYGNARVYYGK